MNRAQVPAPSSLGDRLRLAMKAKGVRNPEIAAAVGVHVKTVSKWLSDVQSPEDQALDVIARMLDVSPAWLRYGDAPSSVNVAGQEIPMRLRVADDAPASEERRPLPRLLRHPPHRIRVWLSEFRLELTKAGATDEEIEEAMALLSSPEVFTFYAGGRPRDFNEEDVLMGMQGISVAIRAELTRRGRKFS